jgi:hypothetical protein
VEPGGGEAYHPHQQGPVHDARDLPGHSMTPKRSASMMI